MIDFIYNDGGRKEAGYKGKTGDCVVRAIAIATQQPYKKVYEGLWTEGENHFMTRKDKIAKKLIEKGASPRRGVYKPVYREYLKNLGWQWVPCMEFGSGCKIHLNKNELPGGNIIVKVSKHLVAVVDGVIHDTSDCSRAGTRCVYGYWHKSE